MKKILATLVLLGFVIGTISIWRDTATTGSPDTLWPWQIASYKDKARSGDGAAQYSLSEHYRAEGNAVESDYWYNKCVRNDEPICLFEEAATIFGRAMLAEDIDSKVRNAQINEARRILDTAQDRLKSGDILKPAEINSLRQQMDEAQDSAHR